MNFTKMQAAGNDFVVMASDATGNNWSALARLLCDRHFGIGADSLLLVLPSTEADFFMRTFDADGSEAEACGNGIRCLAKYSLEKGIIPADSDEVLVETVAGIRSVSLIQESDQIVGIRASMGVPSLAADTIPVRLSGEESVVYIKEMLQCNVTANGNALKLNLVSIGNPHAVFFTETPVAEFPLDMVGPLVERLPMFPSRTNFEVARVLGGREIEARVWERGVGETMACGTGACAITVAASLLGYIEHEAEIILPGGTLGVAWDGRGEVLLQGPAETVFEGQWPER
ncbi:diaminopimelate epimerase [Chloroflexota bacterium]